MSRVKSTNEYAAVTSGFDSQWVHIAAGMTGRTTISPRSGEQVTLVKVLINTDGSGSPTIITDSSTGMIASLGATNQTGTYSYNLPCKSGGNLLIDNGGGADLTVVFKDR